MRPRAPLLTSRPQAGPARRGPAARRLLALGVVALGLGLGTLGLVSGAAHAEEGALEVRWHLGRSDLARYERIQLSKKTGKPMRGGPQLVTVHGHDLQPTGKAETGRGTGQYTPLDPVRGDLPQILALRLVEAGKRDSPVKFDWHPKETGPMRVKGRVRVTGNAEGYVSLEGTYTFKARGKPDQAAIWAIAAGRATSTLRWDKATGVITQSKIELSWTRRKLKAKGAAAKRKLEATYAFKLAGIDVATSEQFPNQVAAAIERGVAFLRTLQEDEGPFKAWMGGNKPFEGGGGSNWQVGTTALAVLTLLSCGVPRKDPAVKKGLTWLFGQDPGTTYERALCLMAVDRAYTPESELAALRGRHAIKQYVRKVPPKRMAWVRTVTEELESSAASPGTWGYPSRSNVMLRSDTSNTQYAVLGLRAAAQLGVEIDNRTWLGVIDFCERVQGRKGERGSVSVVRHGQAIPDAKTAHLLYPVDVDEVKGFRYSTLDGHDHMSSSMTCAGISCLRVALHQLQLVDCPALDAKRLTEVDEMIACAWAWLDQNWAVDRHPGHPAGRWYHYYLYCLERAAILDNVKRVGGKDWYFEGASQLLARQAESGAWSPDAQQIEEWNPATGSWKPASKTDTPTTCFALLFLQRGTAPLPGTITGK